MYVCIYIYIYVYILTHTHLRSTSVLHRVETITPNLPTNMIPAKIA